MLPKKEKVKKRVSFIEKINTFLFGKMVGHSHKYELNSDIKTQLLQELKKRK